MRGQMEQMGQMGSMGLMMVLSTLVLFALIAAAVYVGVRLARNSGSGDSARSLLDRRFASGEVSAEEYREREAVLRSSGKNAAASREVDAG